MMNRICAAALVTASVWAGVTIPVRADRTAESLDGPWQFQREGEGETWKTVRLPCNFEAHEGVDFDGVGVYRKRIEPFDLPEGMRAVIQFQAVATSATVSFDGRQVGSHLGGWTPFRIDVTHLVRAGSPGLPHELVVRVDEKVGHNSQGFLPVVAPHFGGVWQGVNLLIVPERWMDETRLLAAGNPHDGTVQLEMPVRGRPASGETRFEIRYRLLGSTDWSAPHVHVAEARRQTAGAASGAGQLAVLGNDSQVYSLALPIDDWKYWSPESPNLYELEIRMAASSAGDSTHADRIVARAAFRSIRVDGHRLLLNGRPLSLRGLLNWGYAPPSNAPSIDEAHMRSELALARSLGFNLMKFCLWVPPRRYLEIADEMGMLTWMEYPTWHSKWSADQLPTLEKEFTEFFCYDRNHPSVVLRSLTCETGTSADLDVIRTLYDRCHAMIPGSVVEDDSSWIEWNRIHDFYDDHPYGNNHTWLPTLEKLKAHIAKGPAKPLVLGEAIAADTWYDRRQLLDAVGSERPFWLPKFFDGNQSWLEQMRRIAGDGGLDVLESESRHYALLMRKFQIEAYRREVPFGGYVVSVIRDIPSCSMGLLDYLGQSKWSTNDWSWHGETMLLMETEGDRRSFSGGELLRVWPGISYFSPEPVDNSVLTISVNSEKLPALNHSVRRPVSLEGAGLHRWEPVEITLPGVSSPTRFQVTAELAAGEKTYRNEWPLWIVPAGPPSPTRSVRYHASCPDAIQQFLPGGVAFNDTPSREPVIATKLDSRLLDYLESGGRVLVFPDGQKGSFPLSDEWFLRGAPYIADHPLLEKVPRQLLVELQHFDLASAVIPDISYLNDIDPIVMLWNNHDLNRVKTQGLVFETGVGRGRLLVSALRHTGATNAVGRWLADVLLDHLTNGPNPRHALPAATVRALRAKSEEQRIDLTGRSWQFRPDPDNLGLDQKWQLPATPADDGWKPIRIGRAWEGLGYPTLDGWAWYRITVDIPQGWQGGQIYVSFEGADDYYELYVNGLKAGAGGDMETKTTAFEERKSHDVTPLVTPGRTTVLAVRVYDWYGAGGLFRPVTIGTAPIGAGADMLK